VVNQRTVGETHLKLSVRPQGSRRVLDAIAFNQAPLETASGQQLRLVYRLDSNEYRGMLGLQLRVEYLQTLA